MGISKPSQGCGKHQKDMDVLYFLRCIFYVVKGRTFSVYQLATGCGHNKPRLSFDGYFKA